MTGSGAGTEGSPGGETIHGAIAVVAREHPTRTAVRDAERTLDYATLEGAASRLCDRLIGAGVAPGDRVGIYLGRSAQLVVGVLAVLKAGAAYVPLDPEFPADRIDMMVTDADVRVVVTETGLAERAPAVTRLLIDAGADAGETRPGPEVRPEDTAYVIYTSGSTGRPKGVRVGHGSVANLLRSMAVEPGIEPEDVWLALTTLSFDISVLELFGPLLVGATTVIASRDEMLDGTALADTLNRVGATILQATPVTWRLLLQSGWAGDRGLKALCGGEALPAELARELVGRTASLWNMYGPTETTIWSTCYRIPDEGAPVLIGRPIANTTVYVLDAMMRPVPPGVPGEIWIGGAGVAQGYHEREELTLKSFLPDPFSPLLGGRMYRTGDHGRYLRDGNLEYRARIDDQMKIRGHRVEPGEIEDALVDAGGVRQAVVVLNRGQDDDVRLVSFYVANGTTPRTEDLRARLRARLPGYMVPQYFIELAELPLTPNGKVDRRALARRAVDLPEQVGEFVAPRTAAEARVAAVYGEVLGVERVSADADFFDLGGHSVLAMRVIARLREQGAVQLSLRDLFEAPSVGTLAARLSALHADVFADAAEREVVVF